MPEWKEILTNKTPISLPYLLRTLSHLCIKLYLRLRSGGGLLIIPLSLRGDKNDIYVNFSAEVVSSNGRQITAFMVQSTFKCFLYVHAIYRQVYGELLFYLAWKLKLS